MLVVGLASDALGLHALEEAGAVAFAIKNEPEPHAQGSGVEFGLAGLIRYEVLKFRNDLSVQQAPLCWIPALWSASGAFFLR